MDRLRESRELFELLAHYAEQAQPDRQAWQDRLMAKEGLSPRELSKLHGELIGFGWLEQNTGVVPVVRAGAVPGCYRITASGGRAAKEGRGEEAVA